MQLVGFLMFISLHVTLSTRPLYLSLWLFISPFDSHLCLSHLQDLTESELAEMP
jgi:hypothetical protein